MLRAILWCLLFTLGCTGGVRDRFGPSNDATAVETTPEPDATSEVTVPDADPNLGGPCIDDMQCARPEIPCATFKCDLAVKRCRALPDDTKCDDGLYCNGSEKCDPRRGCIPGAVVDCSSGDTCMIDRCVEETRTCESKPRDADGDGDPTAICVGKGNDCDDNDPTVSAATGEICGNKKDDNCNGVVDELDCVTPRYGTCDDAFVIDKPGTYSLMLAGTKRTIAASCAPTTDYPRQLVVAVKIAPSENKDIDIVATPAFGRIALAAGRACGESTTEFACAAQPPTAPSLRMKLRDMPPGAYPFYVLGGGEGKVELKVSFLTPTPPAKNLTCASAIPLLDASKTSAVAKAELVDIGKTPTACDSAAGPLLYRVEIPDGSEKKDLRVRVTAGSPGVRTIAGLRDSGCTALSNELKCGLGNPADLFVRGLSPGTYYITAGVTAASDITIDATLTPATTPPANEICTGAPALPRDTTTVVDIKGNADDIAASCIASPGFMPIAVDAAYSLKLDVASDVLLVARPTGSDPIGLGLASASCSAIDFGCSRGYPSRITRRALPAGDYRVIVESMTGANPSISAFVRPAATPGPVGADKCTDAAVVIPPEGGLFVGSTAGKSADLDASCDTVGMPKGGAPDVIYKLEVTKKGRLIVDAAGSAFTTTISIRKGATCPGAELIDSCAAGFYVDNAFLDYPVDVGTYWIVVDGYSLASGSYRLDVRVAPPAPPL